MVMQPISLIFYELKKKLLADLPAQKSEQTLGSNNSSNYLIHNKES
jgi:hypothetical protein